MNENSRATKWIGMPVERLEDPPLVTGRGRFAGDINFPRQLHMRIVRSNHAHGKIVSVDTEAARALPGAVAVWTSADIPEVPPIDFREGRSSSRLNASRCSRQKKRYVGDPVAAVFARFPTLRKMPPTSLPWVQPAAAVPAEPASSRLHNRS